MCAKHFLSQPLWRSPCCTFRVLNGCSWERKGAFGNGKGPKNAKQKNGVRPVLFLGLNRVGGSVCEALLEPNLFLSQPLLSFLAEFSGPYGHQSGTMSLVPGVVYGTTPPPAAHTAVPVGHLWNASKGWKGGKSRPVSYAVFQAWLAATTDQLPIPGL